VTGLGEQYMRVAVWTTLMCLVMPWARAAAFDCTKASTFVEKAICSDQQLSAMDDQLGRLYKGAVAGASNKAMLKTDQEAWLSARNQCRDADCLKKPYADRINVLGGTSAPPTPGDFTGTYKMENGEVLVQQTTDGRIKFYINATYHTNVGEVSGEVPLTGGCRQLRRSGNGLRPVVQVRARQARRNSGWFLRNGPQCFRVWDLQTREHRSAEIRRMTNRPLPLGGKCRQNITSSNRKRASRR
jgi:uncharacterized protein